MTLFMRVAPDEPLFGRVLDQFFRWHPRRGDGPAHLIPARSSVPEVSGRVLEDERHGPRRPGQTEVGAAVGEVQPRCAHPKGDGSHVVEELVVPAGVLVDGEAGQLLIFGDELLSAYDEGEEVAAFLVELRET